MATLWEFRDHHWLGSGTLEEMMLFYGTFSHILPMIQEVSCMSLDHPFSYVTWSSFLILYPFLEWQGYDCKICRTAANAGGPCYATWGRRHKGNWKPCSFWANGLAPKQQNNGGLLSPKRDLNIQIYASTSRCYGVTCFFGHKWTIDRTYDWLITELPFPTCFSWCLGSSWQVQKTNEIARCIIGGLIMDVMCVLKDPMTKGKTCENNWKHALYVFPIVGDHQICPNMSARNNKFALWWPKRIGDSLCKSNLQELNDDILWQKHEGFLADGGWCSQVGGLSASLGAAARPWGMGSATLASLVVVLQGPHTV